MENTIAPIEVLPAVDNPAGQPEVIDHVAVARLYGEPLFSMPNDLYIPPDALEVFLEAFEGPLDLLLYLIRKQNFNILDIPMAAVTRQYLSYVDEIREHNLELAAEYLLMAAMLIEIKSRMLLPPKKVAEGEEPEDPRAELVRRLLEYEQMKLAAAKLNEIALKKDEAGLKALIGRGFQVHAVQILAPEELQRLRLATQLRAGLFGVLYVLDEPSAGLHPADAEPLLDVLDRLGYDGYVGLEYKPKTTTGAGLGWAAKYGIKHYCWLCINPKEADDPGFAREIGRAHV